VADGSPIVAAALRFAVFALVAIVLPGVALQRACRLRLDPALVLPLGYAFAAAAAALGVAFGPNAFLVAVVLADLALLLPLGPWRRAPGPSLRGALPALAALVLLFAVTQYPLNRRLPTGEFALDSLERIDTAFHVAVTWELVNAPPQVPGLSGEPLGYHVGPHLVRAMAYRFAGTHPYDALSRFDLTLQALALVLALRAIVEALGGGALATALAPFTLLLGDWAWVFAQNPLARWWTELLGANVLVSLFFANSLVLALAMALALLAALARREESAGRGLLALAAVLGLALPFFKVFLAAQLAACALLAFALARGRHGAPALLSFALPSVAALAWLAAGPGGRSVEILLDPLAPAARARQVLGLAPLEGASFAGWGLLCLLLALGARAFALPEALRSAAPRDPVRATLAWATLLGFPVALLLRVTADGEFNEAVYFTNASGVLLWLFALLALERLSGARRNAVLAAALLASVPTTAEFVWRKATTAPDIVPVRVFEALALLEQDTRPGDVVLMRPYSRYPPPPAVFSGRRVAYTLFLGYLRQFVPAATVRERSERVRAFFRAESEDEARAIAERLGARYVFLQGSSAMGPGARAALEPVYVRKDTALLRLRRP
jgi:hypothetical protein